LPARHVLLVGSYDVLATTDPKGALAQVTGFARPAGTEPDVEAWAARARVAGPDAAILVDASPSEALALSAAGVKTIEWPEPWLPVADALYRDPEEICPGSSVYFSGATNERRDRFLQPVKHRFDALHLAGGADQAEVKDLMGRCSVAIDFRLEPGMPRLDGIGPAMAQGMLVLAEQPVDRAGISSGSEMFTFATPEELELLAGDIQREPGRYVEMRRSARQVAEAWRSSTALASLIDAELGS